MHGADLRSHVNLGCGLPKRRFRGERQAYHQSQLTFSLTEELRARTEPGSGRACWLQAGRGGGGA